MKINNNIVNSVSDNQVNKNKTNVSGFDKILEQAKETGDTKQLKEACSEMESIFVNMMMKTMRNSIPEEDGLFKKSEAEKMFSGMLDEEYSKKMSEAGGIGIGDMLFDQMSKYLYNDEEAEKTASSFEMKG